MINTDGSLSISNSAVVSAGSELQGFNGIAAGRGHALGYVSFTLGALESGTLAGGGTFWNAGAPPFALLSRRVEFPRHLAAVNSLLSGLSEPRAIAPLRVAANTTSYGLWPSSDWPRSLESQLQTSLCELQWSSMCPHSTQMRTISSVL